MEDKTDSNKKGELKSDKIKNNTEGKNIKKDISDMEKNIIKRIRIKYSQELRKDIKINMMK